MASPVRRNRLLDWYEKTTGGWIDRMCCGSYCLSQMQHETEEPAQYDALKTAVVSPTWVLQEQQEDDDETCDEKKKSTHSGPKPTSRQKGNYCDPHNNKGHLTLDAGGGRANSSRPATILTMSPAGRSDCTATTVSTSTVRTSNIHDAAVLSKLALSASSSSSSSSSLSSPRQRENDRKKRTQTNDTHDLSLSTAGSHKRIASSSHRSSDKPACAVSIHRYQHPSLKPKIPGDVNSNTKNDLPYLSLTEGYEC